jgi:hypothetical protein
MNNSNIHTKNTNLTPKQQKQESDLTHTKLGIRLMDKS